MRFVKSIYNFFNSESPEYFNEIHFPAELSNINTRSSFQRLKQPLRKSKIEDQLKLKVQEAQTASNTM